MNDREQNHLDFMSDLVDTHYSPGQYHTTPEQDAEIEAKQLADESARRTARASWANTKMLMQAMGVKL